MKKSDIATLILISSVSVIAAYFVAGALIGSPSDEKVTVKTVEAISSTIDEPDPSIFSDNAINPTIEVVIGGSQSQ